MQDDKKQTLVQTVMDKVVPKFCTNISISLLNTKNLVLTMAYNDSKDNITTNTTIIEKIVIDLPHAQSLKNVLIKLLEDIENDPNNSK